VDKTIAVFDDGAHYAWIPELVDAAALTGDGLVDDLVRIIIRHYQRFLCAATMFENQADTPPFDRLLPLAHRPEIVRSKYLNLP